MTNGSTEEVPVVEFRSAIQELLRSRIQEAIQITLEEELTEALGCGPYERKGSRRGYRHGTYRRQITTAQGPQELQVPRGRLVRANGSTEEFRSGIVPYSLSPLYLPSMNSSLPSRPEPPPSDSPIGVPPGCFSSPVFDPCSPISRGWPYTVHVFPLSAM